MTRALDDSKKESILLVEFVVDTTTYRFTTWAADLNLLGATWISTPAMEVKWPPNTGTLEARGGKIEVSEDANLTVTSLVDLLLRDGTPTAPVTVEITEVIRPVVTGGTATELVPFRGRVLRAVRNAGGKSKRIRFEMQSIKSRLDVALGLPCMHHCPWRLFGKGCAVQGGAEERGPQRADEIRTRTISAISGRTITVSSDPNIASPKSLQFGHVQKDGISIEIFKWDSGDPTSMVLRQQPPSTWNGTSVTLVPGCDKSIEACRTQWDNEDNFGGIGYAIPNYNPHYEEG